MVHQTTRAFGWKKGTDGDGGGDRPSCSGGYCTYQPSSKKEMTMTPPRTRTTTTVASATAASTTWRKDEEVDLLESQPLST
jgi:hypothetical protein